MTDPPVNTTGRPWMLRILQVVIVVVGINLLSALLGLRHLAWYWYILAAVLILVFDSDELQ